MARIPKHSAIYGLAFSSSGHLALFQIAFGLEETGLLFDCLLHFGTLVAVFAVYYRDIWKTECQESLSILQFTDRPAPVAAPNSPWLTPVAKGVLPCKV